MPTAALTPSLSSAERGIRDHYTYLVNALIEEGREDLARQTVAEAGRELGNPREIEALQPTDARRSETRCIPTLKRIGAHVLTDLRRGGLALRSVAPGGNDPVAVRPSDVAGMANPAPAVTRE